MQKFVFAYFGRPDFKSEEEGKAHMQEWRDWLENLGDAVVDAGMPIGPGVSISAEASPSAESLAGELSGITVVQAQDADAAKVMAETCPHIGGARIIHIAPAMEMG